MSSRKGASLIFLAVMGPICIVLFIAFAIKVEKIRNEEYMKNVLCFKGLAYAIKLNSEVMETLSGKRLKDKDGYPATCSPDGFITNPVPSKD